MTYSTFFHQSDEIQVCLAHLGLNSLADRCHWATWLRPSELIVLKNSPAKEREAGLEFTPTSPLSHGATCICHLWHLSTGRGEMTWLFSLDAFTYFGVFLSLRVINIFFVKKRPWEIIQLIRAEWFWLTAPSKAFLTAWRAFTRWHIFCSFFLFSLSLTYLSSHSISCYCAGAHSHTVTGFFSQPPMQRLCGDANKLIYCISFIAR